MADPTIRITGKCETDDIATCEFRIRKVGAVIRAQGQKELADAIEQAADRVRKARAKEPAVLKETDWHASSFENALTYARDPSNPRHLRYYHLGIATGIARIMVSKEGTHAWYNRKDQAEAVILKEDELTVTEPTLGESHNVSIPLSCPGTQPVPSELAKALAESEEA